MNNTKINNARYELISSTVTGFKEVQVLFDYQGKKQKYFIFIKEGKNINYLNEAKKQFEKEVASGEVKKSIKKSVKANRPWLIATASIFGVAAITFAGLFAWKTLTANAGETEYIDNVTKKTIYVMDNDAYRRSAVTTNEYNENNLLTKSVLTKYAEDGVTPMTINTDERKFDDQNQMVSRSRITTEGGIVIQSNVQTITYESKDKYFIAESIYTNIRGDVSSSVRNATYSRVKSENETTIKTISDTANFSGSGSEAVLTSNIHSENISIYDKDEHITSGETLDTAVDPDGKLIRESSRHIDYTYEKDGDTTTRKFKQVEDYKTVGHEEKISQDGYQIFNSDGLILETQVIDYSDGEWTTIKSGNKYVYKLDNLQRPTFCMSYTLFNADYFWVYTGFKAATYLNQFGKIGTLYQENGEIDGPVIIDSLLKNKQYDQYHRCTLEENIRKWDITTSQESKTKIEYEYGDPIPAKPHKMVNSPDIQDFYTLEQ